MGLRSENAIAIGRYYKKDTEFTDENNYDKVVWSIEKEREDLQKIYTYEEAINLTGNGWYNVSLLGSLMLAMLAGAMDMFGFSVVAAGCACDLRLSHHQTGVLLSMPLLGAIVMAYPWGYIADTRGRRTSLLISLIGGFVVASLSAFSPNWIVLAVLKFISGSLCSGGQSIAYALLGESCGRTRGPYMIILSNCLLLGFTVFTGLAYLILGMDFSYDLGFIVFKPWRLLSLSLTSLLGLSALLLCWYSESPKFLVSVGKNADALAILRKIGRWNGVEGNYPVKRMILVEAKTFQHAGTSLPAALWAQTAPLFRPPLLRRTVLLFYITTVVYSVNNGFFQWIPILINSFFDDYPASASRENATEGFCDLIKSHHSSEQGDVRDCSSLINLELLLAGMVQGAVSTVINVGFSRLAHRKKALSATILAFCGACCLLLGVIREKTAAIVFFFGAMLNGVEMGILSSYYVELYPTCNVGMASCLGVMVARTSSLAGVNLVGAYIFSHCTASMYLWGAYTISGALVALLLPQDSDAPKKS